MIPDTPADAPLPILWQDEHLVAIHKPAGLLVHRSAMDAGETRFAVQLLRDQLGKPVWPAHRLDKGTSGVLLFALDTTVASLLGRAFEAGAMHKRYLAVVRGWPAAQGVIEHPLSKDPEAPSAGQTMLEARTDWTTLATWTWPIQTHPQFEHTRAALLALTPHTGRRHQIRRHLKHIGHPLIGDATHGKGPLNRAVAAYLGVSRLWLHAQQLAFEHPITRAEVVVEAAASDAWNLANLAEPGTLGVN